MDADPNALRHLYVLDLAVRTAPRTGWEPRVDYDYAGQRYSLSTIAAHFEDMADRARARIMSAPGQWARTGRWPRLRNDGAFFLKTALLWARAGYASGLSPDSKAEPVRDPPWKEDAAVWLEGATVEAWWREGRPGWIETSSREWFQMQEEAHRDWHPYE
ncbi:MAG: hypothetical protein V4726_00980 [Verrucomicrobiota bacterium]